MDQNLKTVMEYFVFLNRNLGKAQDEIAVLRKEGAEFNKTVTNLQNQVISLKFEKRKLEDANEKLRATEIIEFVSEEILLNTMEQGRTKSFISSCSRKYIFTNIQH